MKNKPSTSLDAATLRQQAEQKLRARQSAGGPQPGALVHELQVHQIELEMQNEELHRAQLEAQQAADKYIELFDFAPVGYFVLDRQGLIREVNLAGASLLGLDRQNVTGQPFEQYVVPESRAAFSECCRSGRTGEGRRSCEMRLLHHRHGHRDVLIEATMAEDEPGQDHGCRLAATDITERKQAEEPLRASAQRYQLAVDFTYDWEYWIDPKEQFVYTSPSCERITGHKPAEFLAHPGLLRRLIHPADRAAYDRHIREHNKREHKPSEGEWRVRHKDGTYRWVAHTCQPVFDKDGTYLGVRGSNRDITESKKVEEALRASEERFHRMFESHHAVMLVIDPESGAILDANPAAARFYGYSREQLCARRIQDINQLPPEEVAAERKNATEAHRNYFVFPHRLASGEVRWVEVYSTPVETRGRPLLFSIIHDITARRQAEDALQQLNETLEQRVAERTMALRESERKYRDLFESSQDAIMTLEPPSWKFTSGNQATVEMFGARNEEEFTALGPWELSPAQQPDGCASAKKAREMIETALRAGSHFFEWTHRRLGGEEFPAIVLLSRMQSGREVFLQATVRDITARKRAEVALREAHEFNQQIIASAREGIIVLDRDGKHRVWNPFMEELTGCPVAKAVGQRAVDLFPFLRAYDFERMFQRALTGEIFDSPDIIPEGVRNGRKAWTVARFGPLRDSTGAITGVIAMVNDITERKKLERQLLEISEREQQRMGQDLHDGVSQLLTGAVFLNSTLREKLLARNLSEAADAQRVGEVLAQTQRDVRQVAHGLQPVAAVPEGLMIALAELAKSVSERCGLACRFRCPQRVLIPDNNTATHLFRIAQEAVHNAIRHGQPKKITVTLTKKNGPLVLQVQDNGRGFRLAHGPKAGLGLQIMQSRSEAMSSQIEIRPAKPRGTLVRCTVPRPAPAKQKNHP